MSSRQNSTAILISIGLGILFCLGAEFLFAQLIFHFDQEYYILGDESGKYLYLVFTIILSWVVPLMAWKKARLSLIRLVAISIPVLYLLTLAIAKASADPYFLPVFWFEIKYRLFYSLALSGGLLLIKRLMIKQTT